MQHCACELFNIPAIAIAELSGPDPCVCTQVMIHGPHLHAAVESSVGSYALQKERRIPDDGVHEVERRDRFAVILKGPEQRPLVQGPWRRGLRASPSGCC